MKMEKKTLTSLAIITFLMSSTAVIAMAEGEEARPNTAAALTVQLQGTEEQDKSSSNVPVAPASGGILSALNPFNWFSGATSTSSAPPSAEEQQKNTPSTSNAALVESAEKDSTPAPVKVTLQDFHMGQSSPYTTSGFSALESSHRWTEGTKASIILPLGEMERRPTNISFLHTSGFVTSGHTQHLTVKVNGKEAGSYDYTLTNNNHTIEIPLPEAETAEIEFEIPNAIIPSALGLNNPDKRKLGVLFREVLIQTPTPSVEAQQAGSTIPSAAPAEDPASSISLGGILTTEDDLVHRSQLLTPDQLQRLLQAAKASDQDNLGDAKEILSAPVSTDPSETTPITLTAEDEGWIRGLIRKIFW
jgi:hypothetical protein